MNDLAWSVPLPLSFPLFVPLPSLGPVTLCFRVDNLGGCCPVQGEGVFARKEFYFRARGAAWEFVLALDGGDPARVYVTPRNKWAGRFFVVTGHYDPEGTGFSAGYMPERTALNFIRLCLASFVKGLPCGADANRP